MSGLNLIEIRSQIESSIQRQNVPEAEEWIEKLLKLDRRSITSRLEASEFYRRLSNFSRALEVLKCQKEPFQLNSKPEDEIELYIQYARIRNILGGSAFAMSIIDKLDEKRRQKYSALIAPIILSNYRYADALPFYAPLVEELNTSSPYSSKIRSLGLVDAQAGCGDYDSAFRNLEIIESFSKEPLLQGILHEIRGSLLVKTDRSKDALSVLEKGFEAFPKDTRTIDIGFLHKWYGAALIELGEFTRAEVELEKAWGLLYRRGIKPEAWLEVLYWKGLLEHRTNKNKFPTSWAQVIIFPTPQTEILKRIEKITEIPKVLLYPGDPDGIHLDLGQDLAYYGDRGPKSRWELFLTKPKRMVAYLRALDPFGVPQYRLFDLFWSSEWTSETLQKKRFEQIVIQARKDFPNIKIDWKEHHLRIEGRLDSSLQSYPATSYRPKGSFRGEVFFFKALLSIEDTFSRNDLERFFKVSKTPAMALLKEWLGTGKIIESPRGSYRLSAAEILR